MPPNTEKNHDKTTYQALSKYETGTSFQAFTAVVFLGCDIG